MSDAEMTRDPVPRTKDGIAEMSAEDGTIRFFAGGADEGWAANLRDDPKIALIAACVAMQQSAGFKNAVDLRQTDCPECGAPGFNTGWGTFRHTCGAEICNDDDGTWAEPCGGG